MTCTFSICASGKAKEGVLSICLGCCNLILTLFLIAWTIAGSVWVWRSLDDWQDDHSVCNSALFISAIICLSLHYVVVLLICCCCACSIYQLCVSESSPVCTRITIYLKQLTSYLEYSIYICPCNYSYICYQEYKKFCYLHDLNFLCNNKLDVASYVIYVTWAGRICLICTHEPEGAACSRASVDISGKSRPHILHMLCNTSGTLKICQTCLSLYCPFICELILENRPSCHIWYFEKYRI